MGYRGNTVMDEFIRRVMFPSLGALVFAASAWSSDPMRCGNKLVVEEDTQEMVRAKCGEPSDVQVKTIMRRPTYRRNGRWIPYGTEQVEKRVEFWTYNFGPNKFMWRVRFVDGLVEEIETLGYGTRGD